MNETNKNVPTIGSEPFDPLPADLFTSEVMLRGEPDSTLLSQRKGGELGMEELRLLQARLSQLRSLQPFKRLLITSAVQGEGKTYVATNLAYVLATEGHQRVLLIDADVRHPTVHSVYGLANTYGFKELLRDGRRPSKAVTKIKGSELHVMPCGTAPFESLSPSTILRLGLLLDQLGPAFDLIMLDSPPLLAATDTILVSKVVDASLLVVRAGTTPRELVLKAKELLEAKTILGAVLNRVDPNHYGYASYYSYISAYRKVQTKKKNPGLRSILK